VAETADRVCVMYTGKIVEESGVAAMFEGPKHPYTRGLLNSVPKLTEPSEEKHRRLETIEGTVPSPTELPPGCHFEPRCTYRMRECSMHPIALYDVNHAAKVRCLLFDQEKSPQPV
jgi:peptide/nickel transport system ATP-binding protein